MMTEASVSRDGRDGRDGFLFLMCDCSGHWTLLAGIHAEQGPKGQQNRSDRQRLKGAKRH